MKKYKAHSKKVHKITQYGLIEKDVLTGEEIKLSKNNQNFNLRQNKDQEMSSNKIPLRSFPRSKQKKLQKEFAKTNAKKKEQETFLQSKHESSGQEAFQFSDMETNGQEIQDIVPINLEPPKAEKTYLKTDIELISTPLDTSNKTSMKPDKTSLNFNETSNKKHIILKNKKIKFKINTEKSNLNLKLISTPLDTSNKTSMQPDKTSLNFKEVSNPIKNISKNKKIKFKINTEKSNLNLKLISTSLDTSNKTSMQSDKTSLNFKEASNHIKSIPKNNKAYLKTNKEKYSLKTSFQPDKISIEKTEKFCLEPKTHLEFEKAPDSLEIKKITDKKTEIVVSSSFPKTDKKPKEIENKNIESKNKSQPPKLKFSTDEETPKDVIKNKEEQKLQQVQKKSENAAKKLEKARQKLPKKRKLRLIFDDLEQTPKRKLTFHEEDIPREAIKRSSTPVTIVKAGVQQAKNVAIQKIHSKVREVEDENVAVKATHKIEQEVEQMVHNQQTAHKVLQFVKDRPYKKVEKLQIKAEKIEKKLTYQKNRNENPQLKSNLFTHMEQKRKIKKEYAKKAYEANKKAKSVQTITSFSAKTTKALMEIFSKNPLTIGIALLVLLFLCITTLLLSTFSTIIAGGIAPIVASSYTASDTNIDKAELAYTQWETDLQLQAKNTANTHSGYDEYRYQLGEISHNPYELMAYLTVKYQSFTFEAIEADLRKLFEEQYQYTYAESTETRYDPYSGEPYDWYILTVGIQTKSFTDIVLSKLKHEEKQLFELYMKTKGNRQYVGSPFDFNWLPKISSSYGYRIHPISGTKNYHKGIDIAVPVGTDIHAGFDGKVSLASFDSEYGYYIVIDGIDGLQAKYAHCDTLLASVGQTIKKGDVIAKSGNTGNSTGAHLHMEILRYGSYFNPIFFAVTNDIHSEPVYGDPSSPMGDGSFQALISEAEKYLGYPYVWGGSNPSTSFDCSGFVYWVFNQSGVANFGRTTAQGIYNMSTPVSPSEAKPGDLIFFSGTYSTTNAVSHIGIYVGNGQMIHAGDPISYTNINTEYWQNHFYSFGRLN